MKIASWNVRTLLDRDGTNRPEKRSAFVAAELQRYEIDVAGLQETRFLGSGQLRESNYTFFWSGRPEGERRQSGVALVIRNSLISTMESPPLLYLTDSSFLKPELARGDMRASYAHMRPHLIVTKTIKPNSTGRLKSY